MRFEPWVRGGTPLPPTRTAASWPRGMGEVSCPGKMPGDTCCCSSCHIAAFGQLFLTLLLMPDRAWKRYLQLRAGAGSGAGRISHVRGSREGRTASWRTLRTLRAACLRGAESRTSPARSPALPWAPLRTHPCKPAPLAPAPSPSWAPSFPFPGSPRQPCLFCSSSWWW